MFEQGKGTGGSLRVPQSQLLLLLWFMSQNQVTRLFLTKRTGQALAHSMFALSTSIVRLHVCKHLMIRIEPRVTVQAAVGVV